jgi:molecular chaperone DnaK
MVREAQSNAEADKKKREVIDLRNQIDGLAYNIEKLLKDSKDKISEGDAKPVEEAIAAARKSSESEDVAVLKTALSDLEKVSHKLAEDLYKKTQAAGGPMPGPDGGPVNQADGASGAGSSSGAPKGDVVDAEYEVKPGPDAKS